MSGFSLCIIYDHAGSRPLVIGRISNGQLLQQAVLFALDEARVRAQGLCQTDLASPTQLEFERLERVASILFPRSGAS